MRTEVTIPSGGETLAAYLYTPDEHSEADLPCVVMAHGFSATRDDGLPAYAEAFCAAGLAALVFDYRHFGASTGSPRQLLDVGKQHEDYRAAIAYARSVGGIDPDRIALWGTSFSGGHVIAVAAGDPRIAAVVAQCPFTDGLSALKQVPLKNQLLCTAAAAADQAAALAGRSPVTVAAVAAPGQVAVMTAAEAEPGFVALVGDATLWQNKVAARFMLTLPAYRPAAKAADLAMPLLVSVCDQDQTTPPGPAVKMAERAPRGELLRYGYGHFDIYHDPDARAAQTEFLVRHLAPVAVTA